MNSAPNILKRYRALYRKSESIVSELNILDAELLTVTDCSLISECAYLKGCLLFDIRAFFEARVWLFRALSDRENFQKWLQLKIFELIVVCDLNMEGKSERLEKFTINYDAESEEDKVFPQELRDACCKIDDTMLRKNIEFWVLAKCT